MTTRTTYAIDILTQLYGEPKWNRKGQSTDEIIKLWEQELDGYSSTQIKEACFKIFRSGKANTFPTISQLKAFLFDFEKTNPIKRNEEKEESYYCPEKELFNLVKPNCSFGKFRVAFQAMYNDFLAEYTMIHEKEFSKIIDLMIKNGWWGNKIMEFL